MRANLFICFLILLLSGCGGGSSGANGPDPFNPDADPVVGLTLELLDANCNAVSENTFSADDTICVQATLTSDGVADSGEVVSFSIDSSIGTLSASTSLTNSSGIAQVTLTSADGSAGAATVTAAFGSNTVTRSFEFTPGTPDPVIALNVAVLDAQCQVPDQPVFDTDETICVRATLTSDGQPLAGEVVSFALSNAVGTLSNATVLTSASGIAQVTITNADNTTGASSVTASYDTASSSANYEYIEGIVVNPTPAIEIVVLDASCQPIEEPVFTTEQTICVQATLTTDGEPMVEELVSFAQAASIGDLEPSTALTNSSGIAQVTITPNGTIGATSVTATFDAISASTNYEYVQVTTPGTPTITLEIIAGGVSTNSFEAGEIVAVRALLLGADGVPVSGEIVNFSVPDANITFNPPNDLTENGIAGVQLTATDGAIGAHVMTAAADLNGQTITQTLNFEVLAATNNTSPSISLELLVDGNSGSRFAADETPQIVAVLSDGNNAPVTETIVEFSISTGSFTLSPASSLTDGTGTVRSTLTATASDVGAHVLTATAVVGSTPVTQTFNFEVLEPGDTGTPSIDLDLIVNGSSNNRFEVGENVAIRALFLDANGATVPDTIVSFSVPSADITINPSEALTENGIASAVLVASEAAIGAHVLTATGDLEGEIITSTLSFQVLEATGTGDTPVLSLAILNDQCQADDQSFATNETICLQATLTQNDEPAANEIVSFTLSSNLGSLSANSALTNAQGIAEVQITNANANVGAASVTATFDTISDSQNYEYVALNDAVTSSPIIDVFITDQNRVTAFRAGDEVQARATVLDAEGAAIEGVIVTFAVQNGPAVNPTTGLTNAQGNTQVNLITSESDIGAYVLQASATVNDIQISNSMNFEVQSAGAVVDSVIRIGHFNGNEFIEGVIGSSVADADSLIEISAGATTGFDVALVDENGDRVSTPTPVNFTTTCVTNNQATIDETVTTINGVASATFEDLSCAGATGNTDQIIASVVINNVTETITREFRINAEGIGAISFISATPDSIVLRGTGGQNNASVSTLLFQVNGTLGNPLAQQEVSFALNTTAGGLTLEPATGLTNSNGQVSTRVTAGTVPTPVRVTASVSGEGGNDIITQSDLLSVNTGLPDQNSISISASNLNPEAFDFDGQTVTITARLADAFNNPVPNGTTVNFTSESGFIDSTCLTGQDGNGVINPESPPTGTCSVTWTSSSPRPADHRNTILAYAIGHETLFDANGNNAYELSDGGPIPDTSAVDSGFGVTPYGETGFVDMSEAWLDIDEDRIRDDFEFFIPFNNDGIFNPADGLFNGPQCIEDTADPDNDNCGETRSIHIRRSMVILTSSSDAYWRVYINDLSDTNNIIATNDPDVSITNAKANNNEYRLDIGEAVNIILVYYDTAQQILPSGTQLGTLDENGTISLVLNTVNNTLRPDSELVPGSVTFISQPVSAAAQFSFAIDAPSETRTTINFEIVE